MKAEEILFQSEENAEDESNSSKNGFNLTDDKTFSVFSPSLYIGGVLKVFGSVIYAIINAFINNGWMGSVQSSPESFIQLFSINIHHQLKASKERSQKVVAVRL